MRSRIEVCNKNEAHRLRLEAEHFFRQVIHDVVMAASEGCDKAMHILAACMDTAANCKLAIHPSVRASRAAISAEDPAGQGIRNVQKFGNLIRGKTELVGADLGDQVADAQAGKGYGRIGTGEEGDMHLGGHVLHQVGEHIQNGLGMDGMKIIQDEHKAGRLF